MTDKLTQFIQTQRKKYSVYIPLDSPFNLNYISEQLKEQNILKIGNDFVWYNGFSNCEISHLKKEIDLEENAIVSGISNYSSNTLERMIFLKILMLKLHSKKAKEEN